MKKAIAHLVELTDSDKKKLFKTATVVLDCNILLQLYRTSNDLRIQMLHTFQQIRERLWLPFQVAHEFAYNRPDEVILRSARLNTIKDANKKHLEVLKGSFYLTVDEIDRLEECFLNWEKQYKEDHPESDIDEQIMKELYNILDGKIGSEPEAEQLKRCCDEGNRRAKEKIPPGYKDNNKDNNASGDYIIWQQMMEYAKTNKKDIIFVTNDMKEDWWRKGKGEKIGPRFELIEEFHKYTEGRRFQMYSLPLFLKYHAVIFTDSINEKNIAELESMLEKLNRDYQFNLYKSKLDHDTEQYNRDLKKYLLQKSLIEKNHLDKRAAISEEEKSYRKFLYDNPIFVDNDKLLENQILFDKHRFIDDQRLAENYDPYRSKKESTKHIPPKYYRLSPPTSDDTTPD